MRHRVAVFFPQNLYPPQSGFHQRGLEMLAGLHDLGCEVFILSSSLNAYPQWKPTSITALKRERVKDVYVHHAGLGERALAESLRRFYRLLKRIPPVNSILYTPPGLRRWFDKKLTEISPDIILMNYAYWDGLIDHVKYKACCRVIDNIDLVTMNLQMQSALAPYLRSRRVRVEQVPDQMLSPGFFQDSDFATDPREFRIYDQYDYIVAISAKDARLIRQNTTHTRVLHVPVTYEICQTPNEYDGPAIFPTGPNVFNIQGYLFFVRQVLPQIRERVPSFLLQVTGSCAERVFPAEGVVLCGFVPELNPYYSAAGFAVCPVFGGTGQQVKITEAMAHGVPVIALRAAAENSPIHHGLNGFVADGAKDFAEYAATLWNDRRLCQQLGQAAKKTIETEFSRSRLIQGLSQVFGTSQ